MDVLLLDTPASGGVNYLIWLPNIIWLGLSSLEIYNSFYHQLIPVLKLFEEQI